MRRVHRRSLPLAARLELRRRQASCSAETAREDWRRYRAAVASGAAVEELRRMAGTRQRCFYCRDSRAADVEHFVPITEDEGQTFYWPNLLWVCPECNRRKVSRFPRQDGQPLLINPVEVDPWEHVILDSATGRLAPRFRVDGSIDPMGDTTIEIIAPLNFESVTEGRIKAIRRLRVGADAVLIHGDTSKTRQRLHEAVGDDDFGVANWYLEWEGREETAVRRALPDLATSLEALRPLGDH